MRVTFVLPCRGKSGGVRSTVDLSSRLLRRGYDVRIVYRSTPFLSRAGLRCALYGLRGFNNSDWISDFDGKVESFNNLEQVCFEDGEIVIAVGAMTIEAVYNLQQPVIKIRQCRGFLEHMPELMNYAWGLPMPTIAVSETLIPSLEQYSSGHVIGVVPNGIDTKKYFPEEYTRNGIGTIFSRSPKKSPEDTLTLMRQIKDRWPNLSRYVFGTARRPKELPKSVYWILPPIGKCRELYNRSKIWLVTSRSEGFCRPILEAMACGTMVISTNHDSASGLISHGENGILVPIGDIDAFMEYIDLFLKDKKERQRLVENAFETVRKFTWDKAVDKMEEVLLKVC